MSNASHSRLRKIIVLTQGKARSLHRHIRDTWTNVDKLESFINLLTPQQLGSVYAGDADAVRQVRDEIEYYNPDFVLVVPGDHLLIMQYYNFLRYLSDRKGDAVISIISRDLSMTGTFRSVDIDENLMIRAFREKDPDTPFRTEDKSSFFASMGIYGFRTETLLEALEMKGNLFGKDILPELIGKKKLLAYNYGEHNRIRETVYRNINGRTVREKVDISPDSFYWRDVGTIAEYFRANMDLVSITPRFNLYGTEWPFFTVNRNLGPAKIINPTRSSAVESAIIGESSFLSDVKGRNIVISPDVYIDKSDLQEVVCFSGSRIVNCRIKRTIIDKNVDLLNVGIGFDEDHDRKEGVYIDPFSGIRVVSKRKYINS